MIKKFRIPLLLAAAALSGNLFFGAVWAMSGSPQADISTKADVAAPAQGDRTVVYYFHGTFRCPTCNKMEKYARETIEKDFKNDLDSGKLVFRSVNVEDKGNEHYVKEYQLYTKTLILSSVKGGKEIRSRNLDKIWEYVGDKDRFVNYVRDEVSSFLGEA